MDTPSCRQCWQEGFAVGVVTMIGCFFVVGALLAGLTIWYL